MEQLYEHSEEDYRAIELLVRRMEVFLKTREISDHLGMTEKELYKDAIERVKRFLERQKKAAQLHSWI